MTRILMMQLKRQAKLLVKRIAGVGWQHIRLYNQIYVVPQGCYLMLGDNAADSYDSRYWSNPYVPESDIIAKVLHK